MNWSKLKKYVKKTKLDGKRPFFEGRETLLKFSNCYQKNNESVSSLGQRLKTLADAALRTIKDEGRTERLKEQFMEGLLDPEVKRGFTISLSIKSYLASAEPITFEEVAKYAVNAEKLRENEFKTINSVSSSAPVSTPHYQPTTPTQHLSPSQLPPQHQQNYQHQPSFPTQMTQQTPLLIQPSFPYRQPRKRARTIDLNQQNSQAGHPTQFSQ